MAAKHRTEIVGNLAYIVRQKKDGKQKTLCRDAVGEFVWSQDRTKNNAVPFIQDTAEAVVWALNEA